jgi:hypothetical protein
MLGLIASREALVTGPMMASTWSRPDELDSLFDRCLRIGLVVSPQTLDLPVKQAAALVGLVDRQDSALKALLPERFEAARKRLQNADLDCLGGADDCRYPDHTSGGKRQPAFHDCAPMGLTRNDLAHVASSPPVALLYAATLFSMATRSIRPATTLRESRLCQSAWRCRKGTIPARAVQWRRRCLPYHHPIAVEEGIVHRGANADIGDDTHHDHGVDLEVLQCESRSVLKKCRIAALGNEDVVGARLGSSITRAPTSPRRQCGVRFRNSRSRRTFGRWLSAMKTAGAPDCRAALITAVAAQSDRS